MRLEDIRLELADIDRGLLDLVRKRQELARQVGRLKEQAGRDVRDYAQEKEVIQRARRTATDLGISSGLAESLMKVLIQHALRAQEQQRVITRARGTGRTALIIGGAGRMGRWFAHFLASQGFDVQIADPAGAVDSFRHVDTWTEADQNVDFVVVATQLRVTNVILREIADRQPPGIVFDIGSLKSPLRSGLEALSHRGVQSTSVHPMFGPDTDLLSGRHVILVDTGDSAATTEVAGLFSSTMAEIVEMSLEDHDRLVAFVLGLSHALNLSFVTAMAESGETAPRLAKMSSTTFDEQLEVAGKVVRENPHLYFDIQALNDFGDVALESLYRTVGKLRETVRAGDEERFVQVMEMGRAYLFERAER
jgi:chorismate mutase/prephenate dehydrogenase